MIKANLFLNLFLCPVLRWFTFSLHQVLSISHLKPGNTVRTLPTASVRLLAPWRNHSPVQSSKSLQPWAGGVRGTLQPRLSPPERAGWNRASCFVPAVFQPLPTSLGTHNDSRRPEAKEISMMCRTFCTSEPQFSSRSSFLVFWYDLGSLSSSDSSSRWA